MLEEGLSKKRGCYWSGYPKVLKMVMLEEAVLEDIMVLEKGVSRRVC